MPENDPTRLEGGCGHRTGVVESWLRRCGERRWRTVTMVWLLLIPIGALLGFADFKHESWPDVPPPPESVKYSAFAPAGASSVAPAMTPDARWVSATYVSPAALPAYDIQYDVPRYNSVFRITLDKGQHARLAGNVMTREGWIGWPGRWVEWRSITNYDVTEPSRPFPALKGFWRDYWLADLVIQIGFAKSDGSHIAGCHIFWPAIAGELMLTFAAALAAVLPASVFYRRRRAARVKAGRCAECGYVLYGEGTGAMSSSACPECGAPRSEV